MDKTPYFSIIISTRDRPALFLGALNSVIQQSFTDTEIVVVIDGSTDENLAAYRDIKQQYAQITFLELPHRPNGHGQSYSMNYGVYNSSGKYLCFLDDDDYWTDTAYLHRAFQCLNASASTVDVHYSNQNAVYSNGEPQKLNVWLSDLIPRVASQARHIEDTYFVNADFLLSSEGFAHLNCSIFARQFYLSIGGMDETIRYENDRDVYIRAVDAASVILFSTRYVSVHNIPDRTKKTNMSTVSSEIDKKLYQMRVYDKGISNCRNDRIVRFCSKAKSYEMKHATRILVKSHRYRSAAYYAKAALVNGFNLRWLAYTIYVVVQSRLKPGASHGSELQ